MMKTVLGTLHPEQLAIYRMALAKVSAAEAKPTGYSPSDIESAYLNLWRIQGEMYQSFRQEGRGQEDFVINFVTGEYGYDE